MNFSNWLLYILLLFRGSPHSFLTERTAEVLDKPELCESIPRWHLTLRFGFPFNPTTFGTSYNRCKRLFYDETGRPLNRGIGHKYASHLASEYIEKYDLTSEVHKKMQESVWKSQLEMEVREISLEFPESVELFGSYAIKEKILISMAKSGELDNFWEQAGEARFEPPLKSYYDPKKSVTPVVVETPKYEKDSYDLIYDNVKNFPQGDCLKIWFEFRRDRCWTRQAIVEATKMEQRNSFCSKIEPGSSRQRCFGFAAEIGDSDIRKNLTERGRTDVH